MPIGIPKVPYCIPGKINLQWIDIYNRLSAERVLFLTQNLEEEIINELIRLMLYITSKNEKKDIILYINSPGGSVISGISIVDTIKYITANVNTINIGIAASIASFIVAAGHIGKRVALTHARFIIHQSSRKTSGQATEIFKNVEEIIRLRRIIGNFYSIFTGQPISRVAIDLDHDEFFDANEALEYGLVDRIRISKK